mgnify:CR=1 FL=1
MKKFNLYYLSSLLFFVVAILQFVDKSEHSLPVVWLSLSACFLSLGINQNKKN